MSTAWKLVFYIHFTFTHSLSLALSYSVTCLLDSTCECHTLSTPYMICLPVIIIIIFSLHLSACAVDICMIIFLTFSLWFDKIQQTQKK